MIDFETGSGERGWDDVGVCYLYGDYDSGMFWGFRFWFGLGWFGLI